MANETIGDRIKTRREEMDLTQEQLGALVGVTGSAIHGMETGKHGPRPANVVRLAQALGVSREFLLAGYDGGVLGELPPVEVYLRGKGDLKNPEHIEYLRNMYEKLRRLEALEDGEAAGR